MDAPLATNDQVHTKRMLFCILGKKKKFILISKKESNCLFASFNVLLNVMIFYVINDQNNLLIDY